MEKFKQFLAAAAKSRTMWAALILFCIQLARYYNIEIPVINPDEVAGKAATGDYGDIISALLAAFIGYTRTVAKGPLIPPKQ